MEAKRGNFLILALALLVIGLGVIGFILFNNPNLLENTPFEQEKPLNPIVGTWESEHTFYGKPEVLVFDEMGQIKDGRRVASKYRVEGLKVWVAGAEREVEYRIAKDGLSMVAYMPGVGRLNFIKVVEAVELPEKQPQTADY